MKIIFLAGPSNPGKQIYRERHHPWLPVIGTDSFIQSQAENRDIPVEDADDIPMATMIFRQDFDRLIKKNLSFIVDQAYLTVNERRKLLNLIPEHYQVEIVYWSDGNKNISNFEIPTIKEGFHKILKGE